ncbi:unnamed protein product [Amoebophrya sp. A25]|nr:unnamed protein product [Amoebophrya sp. A25]|eukprot:GSA25T00003274001.1
MVKEAQDKHEKLHFQQEDTSKDPSSSISENGWDYYVSWPGFNIPSWVLKAFIKKSQGGGGFQLRPLEKALITKLANMVMRSQLSTSTHPEEDPFDVFTTEDDKSVPFYVIGTTAGRSRKKSQKSKNNELDEEDESSSSSSAEEDEDEETSATLWHEMAHGLFYTNQEYRQLVDEALETLDLVTQAWMRKQLVKMGYCDDPAILWDEMHAYLVDGGAFDGRPRGGEEDKPQYSAYKDQQTRIREIFNRFSGLNIPLEPRSRS